MSAPRRQPNKPTFKEHCFCPSSCHANIIMALDQRYLCPRALAGLAAYKYAAGGYTKLDEWHNPAWNGNARGDNANMAAETAGLHALPMMRLEHACFPAHTRPAKSQAALLLASLACASCSKAPSSFRALDQRCTNTFQMPNAAQYDMACAVRLHPQPSWSDSPCG